MKKKSKKVKALVNTGATLTALPEQLAKELGIEPIAEDNVMTGVGIIKLKKRKSLDKN